MKMERCLPAIFALFCLATAGNIRVFEETYFDSLIYRVGIEDLARGRVVNFRFPPLEMHDCYMLKNYSGVKHAKKLEGKEKAQHLDCMFEFPRAAWVDNLAEPRIDIKLYCDGVDSMWIDVRVGADTSEWTALGTVTMKPGIAYRHLSLDLSDLIGRHCRLRGNPNCCIKITGVRVGTRYERKRTLIVNDIAILTKQKVIGSGNVALKRLDASLSEAIVPADGDKWRRQYMREKSLYTPGIIGEGLRNMKYMLNEVLTVAYGEANTANGIQSIGAYIRGILERYLTMNRVVSANSKIQEYNEYMKECTSLDAYYLWLEQYLCRLHDVHFKLRISPEVSRLSGSQPLHFYKIGNHVDLVAITDSTLTEKLELGNQLTIVNGLKVDSLLARLSYRTSANTQHARVRKVIRQLLPRLYNEIGDTLKLEFAADRGEIRRVALAPEAIFSNSNFYLGPRLEAQKDQFRFRRVEGYAYMRIGRFQASSVLPFLYSVMDSLVESRGVIVDLRDNGGGDLSSDFMLSFFVARPSVVGAFDREDGNRLSLVVNPDPYYRVCCPVMVLVNANTTCSAELFIEALRRARNDVVVFGATKTAGSAQAVRYMDLPAGRKYRATLSYTKGVQYNALNEVIDWKGGVSPDVYVDFASYQDLAPYNDKLLEYAVDYLDSYVVSEARLHRLGTSTLGRGRKN